MSASLGNTLRLSSSLKMDEDVKLIEKQGIVSILGADCERAKSASLRRTLSADMSSKKWLAQHGFSHMKKIASSQQFIVSAADSSSSEGEDEYEEGKEAERPGMFQTWSSILSQKGCEKPGKSGSHSLPYVHPLVKRSSSSLSEKSLQICTESLGSETGSDGFSSSATTDDEEDQHSQHQQQQDDSIYLGKQELAVVERPDYYSSVRKRLQLQPPSSFPPPLPSLSSNQGPNVRIHSHRRNGRLVLEAVSVSAQNYFQAQRHDGRLVLTFASPPFNHDDMSDKEPDDDEEEGEAGEELERELENFEENEIQMDEDEDEDVEVAYVLKVGKENEFNQETLAVANLPSGVMNVQRSSALMMKKLMGLVNRNPTWPPKHNKTADLQEAAPLPPPPRVPRIITTLPATTAASSLNPYEYYWRSMAPTATAVLNPPPSIPLKNNSDKFILSKSSKAQEQQQLLLLRGNKAEYSVPLLRGCKEPRRSLVIWEPYCIATS